MPENEQFRKGADWREINCSIKTLGLVVIRRKHVLKLKKRLLAGHISAAYPT